MELELTEEQRLVQKTAADFAKSEVLPKAAEIDASHRHPKELVERMAELGLLGIAIDEKYGGSGIDTVAYVLALEEISRACASTGVIMSVNNSLVCDPIAKFGTEEQKQKWLTPLAAGKLLVSNCGFAEIALGDVGGAAKEIGGRKVLRGFLDHGVAAADRRVGLHRLIGIGAPRGILRQRCAGLLRRVGLPLRGRLLRGLRTARRGLR
jgi:alkylation response protein AidB-like acyl-CoA dehydrogenase